MSDNESIDDVIQGASEQHVIDSSHTVEELVSSIQVWGIERNITASGGATALSQIKKLRKEIDELEAGLIAGDDHEITDGIGDALVVLAQIARLADKTWDECLAQSWNDIKDRKGEMHHGIFVKQDDLDRTTKYGYQVSGAANADDVHNRIDAAMAASIADQYQLGSN